MADLTTTLAVKTYLGIDPGYTADDTLLAALVTSASDYISTATGRLFGATSKVDTFDGDGSATHLCKYWPVASVTTLVVDGSAITARATVTGNGFVLDGDYVRLCGYTYTVGVQNCVLTYSAGVTIPTDIAQAAIELAAYRYKSKDRISIANKSIPSGEAVSFVGYQASIASVEAVIESYRRLASP